MQRRSNLRQLRLITEISMTPLVNLLLVLLLLLLFLIASPLVQGVRVASSPAASARNVEAPPETVAKLAVGKDQSLSLDGRPVAPADLKGALNQILKDHPGAGVLVQVHRELPSQVLLDLMDTLRQAGVQKTAVTTLEK